MNGTQTSPIREMIKDFLSPADHFARLKANAAAMETSAWQEIGTWYDPTPSEFDCGFVRPTKVREIVTQICTLYGVDAAIETVLTYLYLKHRALFLKQRADFYAYRGGYYLCLPMERYDYEVTAYGYSGCAAAQGDIVDFESLVFESIPFPPSYPFDLVWNQLCTDHEVGLGYIDYGKVLQDVEAALSLPVECRASDPPVMAVLDDLSYWANEIEKEPREMHHYLALVTHALLMRFL